VIETLEYAGDFKASWALRSCPAISACCFAWPW